MFNQLNLNKPERWHQAFSSQSLSYYERTILITFFAGFTALCAQVSFVIPQLSPVPFTLQTFAVLATGVFLKRNDAFLSGAVYLLVGALGAPVFAEQGDVLFIDGGTLIASGGYLLAFPFASAMVATGLDISRNSEKPQYAIQALCWITAMIPVYIVGTLWLAHSYDVSLSQAYEWGVEPFIIWDLFKIVMLGLVTTMIWSYSKE
ncbi:MAG: biotin transporter BioY [Euryarchaeota archaeon]|jgi:biotin transport system substrate-specific component|nr:biotin transporter BioY [Euryarchaeota archaeon]